MITTKLKPIDYFTERINLSNNNYMVYKHKEDIEGFNINSMSQLINKDILLIKTNDTRYYSCHTMSGSMDTYVSWIIELSMTNNYD